MKERSTAATIVTIELLHKVVLSVTYIHYMNTYRNFSKTKIRAPLRIFLGDTGKRNLVDILYILQHIIGNIVGKTITK